MNRRNLTVWVILGIAAIAGAESGSLTVHVDKPGIRVSPVLYGIFFEEINHAGDGGIYAEMVRNRSMEEPEGLVAWSMVGDAAGGAMSLESDGLLNAAQKKCLKFVIKDPAHVGVANAGYWGMSVKEGAAYDVSFFAKCDFKHPVIVVRIEKADGTVCATDTVTNVSNQWKRYAITLTSDATDAGARLVIAGRSTGTLWLDVVSMFPKDTFKNRPNGLRVDLAQLVADMKPAFNRFPGGCYVEGDKLENRFNWKETLGDIADRPGHWNLWKYQSTDGLGYHEYLQMCEDISAVPLFVVNVGMSHVEQRADDRGEKVHVNPDPYIQDALDAIEYANGPADSKWGSLRVKNGHPAPFNLEYIEIGNENGGKLYNQRYEQFYDAIKAKYPKIKLVANLWRGSKPNTRPIEILDEHYYNSPEFFIGQANRYDSYDRNSYKVYVGEYAVTRGCGKGNLIAALGEAAFMTGMERNSDVVVMTSYAPLFVNTNDRRWNPDAIVFDSARSYGTPSYHVQKMFACNRADVVLPMDISSPSSAPAVAGGIGVGTWNTQAEYKDLKVTRGKDVLYAADFSKKPDGWRFPAGDWKAKDGVLMQAAKGQEPRALSAREQSFGDCTISLKARKLGGAEGFLVLFNVGGADTMTWWNLGGWSNKSHGLETTTKGGRKPLGERVPGSIETGKWYDIRIEITGSRVQCFLDGKKIHDVSTGTRPAIYAVAGLSESTGEVILKVVNVSENAVETKIDLPGASVTGEGSALVMTSGNREDENSFEQPMKIAPVMKKIEKPAGSFAYTFDPRSVTILRVKGK